jgi:hypothetical protein
MMARFETTDKVALIIAALLIVGGFFALLLPQDFTFGRATNFPKNRQETLVEHVTPRQSRLYGLLGVLGGAGLAGYILWATRAQKG